MKKKNENSPAMHYNWSMSFICYRKTKCFNNLNQIFRTGQTIMIRPIFNVDLFNNSAFF